jgi:MbtH protein
MSVTSDRDHDSSVYRVVVNDEEQYSIWPAHRELPAGWRRDGFTGTEEECLAYIDETWTDMRPASLRRWMADHEQASAG